MGQQGRDRTPEERLSSLESWRALQERTAQETARSLVSVNERLGELTDDLHRRQGAEQERARLEAEYAAARGAERENRHERHEWLRALVPNAVLTGVWVALIRALETVLGGPRP